MKILHQVHGLALDSMSWFRGVVVVVVVVSVSSWCGGGDTAENPDNDQEDPLECHVCPGYGCLT